MAALDFPDELLKLPSQVQDKDTSSRLENATDGRRLLNLALQEDEWRSMQRAKVKGCYDGNSPYNQAKLNQQGRAWECNLNFMGLEGIVDSARIPYYSLFSSVPTYATFKTRYRRDDPESEKWNFIVEDEFTCMLNRWKKFKWNIQAAEFEMIFEGWGPLIFEDPADWRFAAKPARHVLTPQEAESCLSDDLPWVIVLCKYRVHQLYAKIKNEKAAADRGWNVQAVQQAILRGTKGYNGNANQTWKDQPWEKWQQMYKNKELTGSYTDCDIIKCAHIYVKEYSGKISQYIFTEGSIPNDKSKNMEDGFLFADKNRFDSYHQCMNVAFQNTGDGTWHSVRGVGLKAFKHEEVRNRLDCRAINNAFLATGIVIQAGDAKTTQKLQLMVNGMMTMIPPGSTFVNHRLAGDIEGPLAVSRYLRNDLSQKIGNFNQRSISRDDGRGEMPTAKQVELQAAKEGSLTASQIDNYYLERDSLYEEVYRRAHKSSDSEAKRFIERCLERGVPQEALDNMEYVKANRASGYGSPQMRKMAMQELMQFYALLNERGKQNALNEIIASSQGADKITVFNPPMEEPDIDEAMAVLENDSLHNGSVPLVISGMDHVAHLNIHLMDGEERLAPLQQAVEAGEDLDPATLQQAYEYVSALGEHSQMHLDRIAGDPTRKALYQEFNNQLKLLVAFHGKLRSAIRAVQAQAAQQARENQRAQALSALDQAKLASAEQQMQIDAMEAQQGMQIKQAKAEQQNTLKRFQVQQKSQLDTVKTAEQIRLDRIKTLADVQNKKSNGNKPNGSKRK